MATPLPLLPCVVLQSAIKFINLTVPSSAGRIATNLRFLQRMGAPRAEAVAGGSDRRRVEHDRPGRAPARHASVRRTWTSTRASSRARARPPSPRSRSPSRSSSAPWSSWRCRRSARRSCPACGGALRPVERRPRPAQATGGLRRKHRLGAALRARARGDLPRLRRPPQPGAARLRQHLGLRPLGPDPRARRDRGRRGQPLGRPDRDGGRQVDGLRDRDHPAPLHLLPAADLGNLSLRWLSRKGYV